jgi:hypothetical protein
MNTRLFETMLWSVLAITGLAVLWLLTRNILAIPLHVPLDPNEGWNAAHANAGALYPPPQSWMVNNYPPLSFYVVRFLTRHGNDAVVAGRWVSLVSFLCTGAGIAAVLHALDCRLRGMACAVMFFAAVLLIGSDYVGMNDPQLLGHALQMGALLLLVRERPIASAPLFAASLFVKHNLLALPLAAAAWLMLLDRRAGLAFLLWGMAFVLAGAVAFQLAFGTSLLGQLASARLSSISNVITAVSHLWWAVLPGVAIAGLWPDRSALLCSLYAAFALVLGLVFAAGDGVDANGFFDLAIALSLGLGLTVEGGRWPVLAAASLVPLLLFLGVRFHDNNYFFTKAFRAESARDIAFLQSHPGPALCDQISLCLWAGKKAEVDVFNIGEAVKAGARDPAPLVRMIQARHFAVLQLWDVDALGPAVGAAIRKHYRVDHDGDNGAFLTPLD